MTLSVTVVAVFQCLTLKAYSAIAAPSSCATLPKLNASAPFFGAKKGALAFSFGNVAQDEGAAMAEYAFKVKHWKTATTVTDNVIVYFKNIVQAFTVRYRELGGKIVDTESFTSGDKTIQNVVSRVNQKKADV